MKALIPVLGFGLLSSVMIVQGAEGPGPYAKVDIGGTIQPDLKIKTVDGVTASGSKFTFDSGMRFDVAGGYKFNESLALELELGMAYNQVDELRLFGTALPRIEPFDPVEPSPRRREPGDDEPGEDRPIRGLHFYQIPIMANVIYSLPLSSRFRPFIGAGAGGIASIFEGEGGHDSDFTFGYQGQAGVNFLLNDNMEIGLAYKFLGSLQHRFSFDFGEIQTDPTYSHSILASFTFNF